MTKICFVRRSFRLDGGAEAATNSYIRALSLDFDITLLTEHWDRAAIPEDAEIIEIGGKGLSRYGKYRRFSQEAMEKIHDFEGLVHSHELVPGASVVRLGDGLHSSWLKNSGKQRFFSMISPFHRLKLKLERKTLSDSSLCAIIVNSHFVGRDVVRQYPNCADKIRLIRNIVRSPFLEARPVPSRDSARLLFVGSGWSRKGLQFLIDAMVHLPEFSLQVVGQDRHSIRYIRQAKQLGVADRIEFSGVAPVTPTTYRGVGALVHPALYEPFPNVAMEALSQGVPVVSSEYSGTSDFSESQGVWTSGFDPAELSENIRTAVGTTSSQRASFREHAVTFDDRYLRGELIKIYSKMIGDARADFGIR